MWKTILKLSFLFVVIGVFGWIFYYILTQKFPETNIEELQQIFSFNIGTQNETTTQTGTSTTSGQIREFSADEIITKISNGTVFDYSVLSDTEIYYFSEDGKVFLAQPEGDELVSSEPIESLNKIKLSQDKKRALVSFGNPQNPSWSIYDFQDKSWRPLQKNLYELVWDESGENIYGLFRDGEKQSLIRISTAKNTLQLTTLVSQFLFEDIVFSSVGKNKIIFTEKPSVRYPGNLYELDLKNFVVKKLLTNLPGLLVSFPNNLSGFFFATNQKFSLIDLQGNIKNTLPLQTLPEKCTIQNNETAYCFSFQDIPQTTILPDDYLKNKFNSINDIYKISLRDGATTLLTQTNTEKVLAIDGIKLLSQGSYLYFINKYDKSLYRLNLNLLEQTNDSIQN